MMRAHHVGGRKQAASARPGQRGELPPRTARLSFSAARSPLQPLQAPSFRYDSDGGSTAAASAGGRGSAAAAADAFRAAASGAAAVQASGSEVSGRSNSKPCGNSSSSARWLETYLQGWDKTLVVVSHARSFLNLDETLPRHLLDTS